MPKAVRAFLGYRVESYKLWVFVFSAHWPGVAGALYVPQVGIINPGEFAPLNSIEVVIWVAVGGRGVLYGAVIGRVARELREDVSHGALPECGCTPWARCSCW
jgi:urea transport system permease protein